MVVQEGGFGKMAGVLHSVQKNHGQKNLLWKMIFKVLSVVRLRERTIKAESCRAGVIKYAISKSLLHSVHPKTSNSIICKHFDHFLTTLFISVGFQQGRQPMIARLMPPSYQGRKFTRNITYVTTHEGLCIMCRYDVYLLSDMFQCVLRIVPSLDVRPMKKNISALS